MLGTASVFKLASGAMRNPEEQTLQLLAQALQPFPLRRTKEQVARQLPPKSEQTIHCVMESVQRKLYDELRQHYHNSLLKKIETDGLAKSKIQCWKRCCGCVKRPATPTPAYSIRSAQAIPVQG